MMSQVADFNYGESSQLGARVLELPYAGSNLSMILLLPNANGNGARSLASVVKKLSSAVLRDAISAGKLQSRSVDVLLPKFKFRGELSENLVTALKQMGIVDIFDGNRADLSQFSSEDKLAVSDIIHKAYVDVNEEGTEAAAATALFIVPDIFKETSKTCRIPLRQAVRLHGLRQTDEQCPLHWGHQKSQAFAELVLICYEIL
ncbi:leukocyte elastase inhibitor-like [Macrobrachium rosenbergii]|uniref:leukocyte elastase inhibitor-like n=1 Tax=Macrobrachium rosenbergii TaxID=79674 RepID=UPI0034D58EA5